MKKTQPVLQRKSRRLSLNRETIQVLNDPALLELARGEGPVSEWYTGFSEGGLGCQTVTGSGETC